MATALASALSARLFETRWHDSEITLRGRYCRCKGSREGPCGAQGRDTMIIPDENNKDLEELPDNVADDMTFILSHMDECWLSPFFLAKS